MTTDSRVRDEPARIAGNAAALLLSKGFSSILLLGWQIVLARQLGAGQYGVYGTIGALMAVAATIPDFGTGVIVVRDVARRPDQAGPYLKASVAVSAMLAIVGYAVVQIAAAWFGYPGPLRAMLWFVGVNLAVDLVGTAGQNVLVATERIRMTAVLAVAHVVVLVTFGSLALAAGGGLWAVYAVMLTAGALRSAAYVLMARRFRLVAPQGIDAKLVRYLIASGAPLGVAAFLSLGFLHADKLVATAILGASATGQLTAAFVVVFGIVELFGTTVLVAVFPSMSRLDSGRQQGTPLPVLSRLLPLEALIGAPLSIIIVVFAPGIAKLVFGENFEGAGAVLRVMGWCILVRMIEGALAQVLTVQNRQSRVLAARGAGLAFNLALTVTLLRRIGITGAAYGMLVGESAIVLAMLALLQLPRAWWMNLGGRVARLALPLLGLLAMLAVTYARLPMIVAMAASLAAYAAVAVAAGAVTADDRRVLMDVAWSAPGDFVARWWSQL